MKLSDFLTPDGVVGKLRAADKGRLLTDLAGRAAAVAGLNQADVLRALTAREELGSTGIGGGVAIPHARIAGIDRFFGLFARLERPVDFDAVDEQPVDLVFLLLAPAGADDRHLQALACVSRHLRDGDVVARLRRNEEASGIFAILIPDSQPIAG